MSDARRIRVLSLAVLLAASAAAATSPRVSCVAPDRETLVLVPDRDDAGRERAEAFVLGRHAGAGTLDRYRLSATGTIEAADGLPLLASDGTRRPAAKGFWGADRAGGVVLRATGTNGAPLVPVPGGGASRSLPAAVAVAVYGTTAGTGDAADAIAFVARDDGALEAREGSSGRTLWVFEARAPATAPAVPPAGAAALSPAVRVVQLDAAGGERLLVVFRAVAPGQVIVLDVTERMRPRLLWRRSDAELPAPFPGRAVPPVVRLRAARHAGNPDGTVILGAGGLGKGAGVLYALDLFSGMPLGVATGARAPARGAMPLAALDRPFLAAPKAVDLDGDGYAERAYAVDAGGRLWRFDFPALAGAGLFGRGRVLAAPPPGVLPSGHGSEAPPDAALVRVGGRHYLALTTTLVPAAGPASVVSLRDDPAPDASLPGGPALVWTDLGEGGGSGPRGWRRVLSDGELPDGGPETVAGRIYLVTRTVATARADACAATDGTFRIRRLDARSGIPLDAPGAGAGVVPGPGGSLRFAYPPAPAPAGEAVCLVGIAPCGRPAAGRPVLSGWSEPAVD